MISALWIVVACWGINFGWCLRKTLIDNEEPGNAVLTGVALLAIVVVALAYYR